MGGESDVPVLVRCGRNWIIVTEVLHPRVILVARDIYSTLSWSTRITPPCLVQEIVVQIQCLIVTSGCSN